MFIKRFKTSTIWWETQFFSSILIHLINFNNYKYCHVTHLVLLFFTITHNIFSLSHSPPLQMIVSSCHKPFDCYIILYLLATVSFGVLTLKTNLKGRFLLLCKEERAHLPFGKIPLPFVTKTLPLVLVVPPWPALQLQCFNKSNSSFIITKFDLIIMAYNYSIALKDSI